MNTQATAKPAQEPQSEGPSLSVPEWIAAGTVYAGLVGMSCASLLGITKDHSNTHTKPAVTRTDTEAPVHQSYFDGLKMPKTLSPE